MPAAELTRVEVAISGGCWHTIKPSGSTLSPLTGDGEPGGMRYESSVTSVSWIPSEAVTGSMRLAFDAGFGHYDEPPPAEINDLAELEAADRFRFANQLRASIEVAPDGRITAAAYIGSGLIGSTVVQLGALKYRFQAAKLPDIQHALEYGDGCVRFVQTVGGRTGAPMPRRVSRKPYVQWQAPLVWTTLALTLHADGRAEFEMIGASPFPRHWIYDAAGQLAAKSGLASFKDWMDGSGARHTPWGEEDSPALVTAVETALERTLSVQLMHGASKPAFTTLKPGDTLVRQGQIGSDLFLVLDGVIRVDRDGAELAEYGPGAILGERSHLETGVRTSTLVAVTPCRVAAVPATHFGTDALIELAAGHRREEAVQGG